MPPPPAGINKEVRDGTSAFKVVLVDTAKTLGGDAGVAAQGIYVLPGFSVTNVGQASQKYFVDYQRLLDRQGQTKRQPTVCPVYYGV